MTTHDILTRLENVHRSGQGWIACCPAHQDRSPSLSVRAGDHGETLIHCHAGCTAGEIVQALRLKLGDLFAEARRRPEPAPRSLRERILRDALAEPWARPGVLEAYAFADQIRRARRHVDIRRSLPGDPESPDTLERLVLAAEIETRTNELEWLLDEVAAG